MIRFIKENIYESVRMFVNQIAITIFGLMLVFAVSVLSDKSGVRQGLADGLLVGTSLLSILFYLYLLYYMTYELGQKDGIKIAAGRMTYNPWKGFFISLIANILNILLGLLELISKLCINGISLMQPVSSVVSSELSPVWAIDLYSVCHTIARFIQGMYIGVGSVWFEGAGFYDLLTPFVAIIVCTVTYRLGVRYCDGFRQPKNKSVSGTDRYQMK